MPRYWSCCRLGQYHTVAMSTCEPALMILIPRGVQGIVIAPRTRTLSRQLRTNGARPLIPGAGSSIKLQNIPTHSQVKQVRLRILLLTCWCIIVRLCLASKSCILLRMLQDMCDGQSGDIWSVYMWRALPSVVAVVNSLEKCFAARTNCRRPCIFGTFHSDYM